MKTVLFNGKIYVDKGHFEEALLQEDGVIVAVGKNSEILAMAGDAERYDPKFPAISDRQTIRNELQCQRKNNRKAESRTIRM